MAINQWNIKSRATVCSHSEKAFEDGEEIHAAIFDAAEEEGFERRDFCADSWKELRADESAEKPFSHWRTTFEAAPETQGKKEVVEKESAEALLRRLIEEDESSSENARFILAVMLERKKILLPMDAKDGEDFRMLFYEHLKTGETFIVRDPLLKLAEIDALQEEVAGWLGVERKAIEPTKKDLAVEGGEAADVADKPADAPESQEEPAAAASESK